MDLFLLVVSITVTMLLPENYNDVFECVEVVDKTPLVFQT